MYRCMIRFVLGCYVFLLKNFLCSSGRVSRDKGNEGNDGIVVLLTGKFYSKNWIEAHLKPLSLAKNVKCIYIVSKITLPEYNNIHVIIPSAKISLLLGETLSRLITFVGVAFKKKPNLIGGFHLLLNGLIALFVARLIGAKSLYNCGGGIREVVGGGYSTENRIFGRLDQADKEIEKLLLEAVSLFDFIIVRGRSAMNFFSQYVRKENIYIVTGGIDGDRFYPSSTDKKYDLILIGRLSSVKRVDLFIQCVALLASKRPEIKAVVVGNGPLLHDHMRSAERLGLTENIDFVGARDDVENYLHKSKIFVLTSDSEGLSLALIEAMLCGLPAVVSDVGDLGDLVLSGRNGFLVKVREPENFALACQRLLDNPDLLSCFATIARRDAERCEIRNVARLWGEILGSGI